MPDSEDRINDLQNMISYRFDDTNSRIQTIQNTLSGLETKDHAASELSHVNYRINDIKEQIDDSKEELDAFRSQIYRTVTLITSILSIVVSIASSFLPSLH